MTRHSKQRPFRPATLLAQGMPSPDAGHGAIVPVIDMATTYARGHEYELIDGQEYSRDHNPTYRPAELLLARLEEGADAILFASGMAAASAVLATLKPGDHMVLPKWGYHGLRRHFSDFCRQFGMEVDLFDAERPDSLQAAIRPGKTRWVWVETPANPTWVVTDLRRAADLAHHAGALLAVDATVMTPILCRPLTLGADLVMHSASKYLNGHSDVIAGALVTAKIDDQWGTIKTQRKFGGGIIGPFEAWLLLRGMRTLHVRVREACNTALKVARYFDGHEAIKAVLYPGLPSHPGHEIAKAQMAADIGYGGMLSLRVKAGRAAAIRAATRTKLFKPATSLGGVESLIEHRATIEGADSPTPDDLLRLSIGLEDADDLIADLEQAFG